MKVVKSIGYFLLALIVAATLCADFIIMGLFGDIDFTNGLSTGIGIALIVMVSAFAAAGKIIVCAFLLVKIVLVIKRQ